MGKFLEEVTRLNEEIAKLRASRSNFAQGLANTISVLRSGVNQILGDFHAEREDRFGQDCQARDRFKTGLEKEVHGLQTATEDFRDRTRQEQHDVAEQTKAARTRFVDRMASDVAGFQSHFHKAFKMAAQAGKAERVAMMNRLADHAGHLRKTMDEFQSALHNNRVETSRTEKRNRFTFLSDLTNTVMDLRTDVAADIAGIRAMRFGGRSSASRTPAISGQRKTAPERPAPKTTSAKKGGRRATTAKSFAGKRSKTL